MERRVLKVLDSESAARSTLMKTGEVVIHFGLYSSECCTSEIELKKLDVFPSCPWCRERTIWDCIETWARVYSQAA